MSLDILMNSDYRRGSSTPEEDSLSLSWDLPQICDLNDEASPFSEWLSSESPSSDLDQMIFSDPHTLPISKGIEFQAPQHLFMISEAPRVLPPEFLSFSPSTDQLPNSNNNFHRYALHNNLNNNNLNNNNLNNNNNNNLNNLNLTNNNNNNLNNHNNLNNNNTNSNIHPSVNTSKNPSDFELFSDTSEKNSHSSHRLSNETSVPELNQIRFSSCISTLLPRQWQDSKLFVKQDKGKIECGAMPSDIVPSHDPETGLTQFLVQAAPVHYSKKSFAFANSVSGSYTRAPNGISVFNLWAAINTHRPQVERNDQRLCCFILTWVGEKLVKATPCPIRKARGLSPVPYRCNLIPANAQGQEFRYSLAWFLTISGSVTTLEDAPVAWTNLFDIDHGRRNANPPSPRAANNYPSVQKKLKRE